MSVTCLLSNIANDLRCPVCGQGFVVFAERSSATAREQMKRRVQRTMRSHHTDAPGKPHVHPATPFTVEGEDSAPADVLHGWMPRTDAAQAFEV